MHSDESSPLATQNPSVGGGRKNLTVIELKINIAGMIAIFCLLGVFTLGLVGVCTLCLVGIAAPDPITAGIAGGIIGITSAIFFHSYETCILSFFLFGGVAFVSNFSPQQKQQRSNERG